MAVMAMIVKMPKHYTHSSRGICPYMAICLVKTTMNIMTIITNDHRRVEEFQKLVRRASHAVLPARHSLPARLNEIAGAAHPELSGADAGVGQQPNAARGE